MSIYADTPGVQTVVIPVANVPQVFEIALGSTIYTLTCKWNDIGQYWALDIADSNANPIVSNVPLITGLDCLDNLDYLDIGGSIYVVTNGADPYAPPTLENLGIDSNVYFLSVPSS